MTDARVRESCGRCHADLTGQPWNERHVCDAMIGGQVAPVPNREKASWELVIEDMRTRDEHGRGKYGTPLQPFNGRDSLWDAYEESLDQTVYLRNAITETRTLRADHNRLKFEKQVFDVEIGKRDRRIRELEGQLDNPQRDYVLEIVRQRNTELEDRIRELEAQLHTRVEHVCDVICDLAGCLPAPPTGLGPPRTDPKPAGGSEPVPADPNSREPVLPYDPNDIPF